MIHRAVASSHKRSLQFSFSEFPPPSLHLSVRLRYKEKTWFFAFFLTMHLQVTGPVLGFRVANLHGHQFSQ